MLPDTGKNFQENLLHQFFIHSLIHSLTANMVKTKLIIHSLTQHVLIGQLLCIQHPSW